MPVTSTPGWQAPHSGLVGDASAIAGSAQVNQLLGTHQAGLIFLGNSILTPNGKGASPWALSLLAEDIDQPFAVSGTAIGRVQIPLLPVGAGADLLVSLCADNAGQPGTVVAQTRIPAAWISQLAAVNGTVNPGGQPITQPTGNPLALAQYYSFASGPESNRAWSAPAASDGSPIEAFGIANATGHMILVGGASSGTGTVLATVYTMAYDEAGNISPPIPQPSLPSVLYGSGGYIVQTDPASSDQTLIVAGGSTTSTGTTPLAAVYAASFDPATGSVASWSTQTALPVPIRQGAMATSGAYVYVIGGYTTGGSQLQTVYYAQVQNGQITAWSTTTPMPAASGDTLATVVGDFLFIGPGDSLNAYAYAPINTDGTLGAWRNCPPFNQVTPTLAIGDMGVFTAGGAGGPVTLSVTDAGPDYTWQNARVGSPLGELAAVSTGANGQWQAYVLATFTSFATFQVTLTPRISVPLPATGLTSGATYHVLLQQQGGDLNDYLATSTDFDVFTGNPTMLTSTRGAYSWTATSPAGTAVPIQVFDQTIPYPGAMPWHSWEDGGARITTVVCATTPDQRLMGLTEATQVSNAQNANQGFESGIAPWTVTGGTVAQSTGEVFEGVYAAKVTPSGSDSIVYLQSELLPCMPGQSITVEGRLWFSSAVTSNASVSVNWFTLAGAYVSTSSNNVSVGAATWTDLANTFTAPAGAYKYTINPALSGTPAASNIFYVDLARGYPTTVGPQLATVVEVEYPGSWPGQTWPPLGLVELA